MEADTGIEIKIDNPAELVNVLLEQCPFIPNAPDGRTIPCFIRIIGLRTTLTKAFTLATITSVAVDLDSDKRSFVTVSPANTLVSGPMPTFSIQGIQVGSASILGHLFSVKLKFQVEITSANALGNPCPEFSGKVQAPLEWNNSPAPVGPTTVNVANSQFDISLLSFSCTGFESRVPTGTYSITGPVATTFVNDGNSAVSNCGAWTGPIDGIGGGGFVNGCIRDGGNPMTTTVVLTGGTFTGIGLRQIPELVGADGLSGLIKVFTPNTCP
jgi:hypothetical protein